MLTANQIKQYIPQEFSYYEGKKTILIDDRLADYARNWDQDYHPEFSIHEDWDSEKEYSTAEKYKCYNFVNRFRTFSA